MLAAGAVFSAPAARPIASMVVPLASASDTWMDAGAGHARGGWSDLALGVMHAPGSVLSVAAAASDRSIGLVVGGLGGVEEALAVGDAMTARTTADGMLALLRAEVDAAGMDAEAAAPVALRLCELRARSIWALGAAPKGSQGRFLARTVAGATLGDWQYGVPASVTLAQAILESDWGRSAPGYNLFGLKGQGPAGSTVRHVIEYRHGRRGGRADAFRAYHDETEALEDHARILGTRPRYARARAVSDDHAAFARALVGTYASDPGYARKLERLIDAYDLDRFDWSPRASAARAVEAAPGVLTGGVDALLYAAPPAWPAAD